MTIIADYYCDYYMHGACYILRADAGVLCGAGMEVAAALTDKAHSVSIIGIESIPFKKALGEKVGKAIMKVGDSTLKKRTYYATRCECD